MSFYNLLRKTFVKKVIAFYIIKIGNSFIAINNLEAFT